MKKFDVLVRILDVLRKEAPENYSFYHPLETNIEDLNKARARAYIHLFLKVKFGLTEFKEREKYVTDGPYDGGIDGYYVDKENRKVIFVQSKFRNSEQNFESREIKYEELLNMDIDRITDGYDTHENGVEYNSKIKSLISDIQNIPNIGKFTYEIIILANVKEIPNSKLRKLTNQNPCEVYDYKRSYSELVFPIVAGTYYNLSELSIFINLSNKSSEDISYSVNTEFKDCDITVLFVPTIEIGKILYKFKNSILKFNPRSYLDLKSGSINNEIANTILKKQTNEFALFNNGITMLSDGTSLNKKIGKKGLGQLTVVNPQIINGGQTAFTLSRIYEDMLNKKLSDDIFNDKEVLLKIITFGETEKGKEGDKLKLIEAISKSTNQQTPVTEADRRSNDKIQIELQKLIFDEFGYFYQRKSGEFGDGLKENYVYKSNIIERDSLMRICLACDHNPSQARRSSENILFRKGNFDSVLKNVNRYREYFFAYKAYLNINLIQKKFDAQKNNKDGIVNYGYALRYGKYAVVSVVSKKFNYSWGLEEIEKNAQEYTEEILEKWLKFEESIISKPLNSSYFRTVEDINTNQVRQILNYDGYYKGRTVNDDLKRHSF